MVLPDLSAGYQPAIDPTTGQPIPGQFTFGSKPISVPQPNAAQTQNLDAGTMMKAHEVLQKYDDDIEAWHRAQERWLKDNSVTKPDPARLKELQRLRQGPLKLLETLNATPNPAAGSAGVPPASANPAQPRNRAEFDALSSGTLFVNPADGRILRKK
jgi:hypothetical protein